MWSVTLHVLQRLLILVRVRDESRHHRRFNERRLRRSIVNGKEKSVLLHMGRLSLSLAFVQRLIRYYCSSSWPHLLWTRYRKCFTYFIRNTGQSLHAWHTQITASGYKWPQRQAGLLKRNNRYKVSKMNSQWRSIMSSQPLSSFLLSWQSAPLVSSSVSAGLK